VFDAKLDGHRKFLCQSTERDELFLVAGRVLTVNTNQIIVVLTEDILELTFFNAHGCACDFNGLFPMYALFERFFIWHLYTSLTQCLLTSQKLLGLRKETDDMTKYHRLPLRLFILKELDYLTVRSLKKGNPQLQWWLRGQGDIPGLKRHLGAGGARRRNSGVTVSRSQSNMVKSAVLVDLFGIALRNLEVIPIAGVQ
jgi:hypothetical protein